MGCSRRLTFDEVLSYARRYGARDPLLVAAMAYVESNFCVDARGAAGECGIMQIKPSTASDVMKQPITCEQLDNPAVSIAIAVRYLHLLQDRYGERGGISAYNAGRPVIGGEYERKVLAAYSRFGGNAARYGGGEVIRAGTTPAQPHAPTGSDDETIGRVALFSAVMLGTFLLGTAIRRLREDW